MAQVRDELSLEEFRALPEQTPYLEYWNGAIVQKMAPQKNHSWLQDHSARSSARIAGCMGDIRLPNRQSNSRTRTIAASSSPTSPTGHRGSLSVGR